MPVSDSACATRTVRDGVHSIVQQCTPTRYTSDEVAIYSERTSVLAGTDAINMGALFFDDDERSRSFATVHGSVQSQLFLFDSFSFLRVIL